MRYFAVIGLFFIITSFSFIHHYSSHTNNTSSSSLILLDKQVANSLIDYWSEHDQPSSSKVKKLDEQIGELSTSKNIHLFSHGRSGELFINNQWMNSEQIALFLKKKGLFLYEQQHLLIYGCEFAKGEKGQKALRELKSILGDIKITASDDITGIDGDWDLEIGDLQKSFKLVDYRGNLQTGDGTPSWKAAREGGEDATVHLGLFNGNDVESDIHTYDAEPDARLYIALKEGDNVYVGMNCKGNNTDFDFQVRGPVTGGITANPLNSTGTEPVIFGPTLAFGNGTGLNSSGAGYVADEATACNGVNQVTGGTSGYDGLQIVNNASVGYYYIEFEKIADKDLTTCIFDVTVVSNSGVVQSGRLFSYRWSLYNQGTGSAGFKVTDLDFYSYHTRDSTVSFFQMDDVVPGGFQIAVTDHGLADNGNLAVDRKSVPYSTTANDEVPGDFPIFFSEPDECFFPLLTSEPNVVVSPIFCDNLTSTVDVYLNRSGSALVYFDFNDNGTYEDGTDVIIGDQIFDQGITSLFWDGNDASGNPVMDGTKISVIIVFRLGETHIPLGDFEANPKGFSGDLIKPTSQASNLTFFWDHSCLSGLTAANSGDFGSLQNLTNGCTDDMCNTWDPGTAYAGSDANQAWVNTWFANTLTFKDDVMVVKNCDECITLVVETSAENCDPNSALVEIFIFGGTGQYTVTGFPNGPVTLGTAGESGVYAEVATGITTMGIYKFTATDIDGCEASTEVSIGEDCVLPVELLYFNGKETNCTISLNWKTASEINNSHFELEHSLNGKEFNFIKKIKGAGNSLTPQEYSYQHGHSVGINYYRLKQIDIDGSFEYTETIAVVAKCQTSVQMRAFPNPVLVNQELSLTYRQNVKHIKILDMYARLVKVLVIENDESNTAKINISDLNIGQYLAIDDFGNTIRFVVIE